jgi:hypothetical protein
LNVKQKNHRLLLRSMQRQPIERYSHKAAAILPA